MKEIEALKLVLAMAEAYSEAGYVCKPAQKGDGSGTLAAKLQEQATSIVDALVAGIGKIAPMDAVEDTFREEGVIVPYFLSIADVREMIQYVCTDDDDFEQYDLDCFSINELIADEDIWTIMKSFEFQDDQKEILGKNRFTYQIATQVCSLYVEKVAETEESQEAAE